ncbi:hypothetical protein DPMN_113156 [Dreissena polymorpha]|uniref:Uncharacterized protein n=1 Tax=Dreissena polymorpha TaxID=45954 RepID=A0A9D4KH07_DREPO|nr:hypothetical protein DPMN_113156 [Dreissena polymorpha]
MFIQVQSSSKSVHCIIAVMNLVTERTVMRSQFMETHTCTNTDADAEGNRCRLHS